MAIRQGLRVGFCGAGGTGKTTSRDFIAEQLDLPTLKSASRKVYEELGLTEEKVLKNYSPQDKIDLQFMIFNEKIKQDTEFSYVADRTVLDHYAYCLAYCGGFIEDDQFREWEEKTRQLMLSTYSHIFYFPWGYWEPETDGLRQVRLSWQSQIDSILTGYIVRWNLPVIEVPQIRGQNFRNEFILSKIRGN